MCSPVCVIACTVGPVWQTCTIQQCAVLLEAKWAPFGPTCMKLYEIKLGIITLIISEYMVAVMAVSGAGTDVLALPAGGWRSAPGALPTLFGLQTCLSVECLAVR